MDWRTLVHRSSWMQRTKQWRRVARRALLRWSAVPVAFAAALVLILAYQTHTQLEGVRRHAHIDAASLRNVASSVASLPADERSTRLTSVLAFIDGAVSARVCMGSDCVNVRGSQAHTSCSEWSITSACIEAPEVAGVPAAVSLRFRLIPAYERALENTLWIAGLLLIAAGFGWYSTYRYRERARDELKAEERDIDYDALTGVLTRASFEATVTAALERPPPQGIGPRVLIYIDVDGLGNVNDQWGHPTGDRLLGELAHRLRRCVDPADVMGRLGGDEFGVFIAGHGPPDRTEAKTQALLRVVDRPFEVDGHTVRITLSAGSASLDWQIRHVDEAVRRADVALYEAKRNGRGQLHQFKAQMDAEARLRYLLQAELKTAVSDGQLYLEYQPQVDSQSQMRGLEALVRWRHPRRGFIPTEEFIPVAENSGLIVSLGMRVVEMACTDLVRARKGGVNLPYVSVNLSSRQLLDPELENGLTNTLKRHGLGPRDLELEVTEGSLMASRDSDDIARRLALRGFRIAIDDFGTGYSSLGRLHRMPVNKLKIDRSFVRQLSENGPGLGVAKSILDLASQLRLKTVAEGVETHEQASWLRNAGCMLMQGYLYARPMSFRRLMLWVGPASATRVPDQPMWAETSAVTDVDINLG